MNDPVRSVVGSQWSASGQWGSVVVSGLAVNGQQLRGGGQQVVRR